MDDKLKKLINNYISMDYNRLLQYTKYAVFKNSESMFNITPGDALQSAAMRLLGYVDKNPDSFSKFFGEDGEETEAENLRGYVFNSIKRNIKSAIYEAREISIPQQEAGLNVEAMPEVSGVYGRVSSHDDVEYRDVLDKISPGFVRILKSSNNGDPISETVRKVGLSSIRGYYVARDNLEKELTHSGVDIDK